MRGFVHDRDVAGVALFEARGYAPVRNSYRMLVDLPAEAPDAGAVAGFSIRDADPRAESRAVYDLNRAAFADAWGGVREPYDSFLHDWGVSDDLRGGFWLVAQAADGGLAGVCLCRVHEDGDPDLGWVSTLGVSADARRRGLGRALLQAAFARYHARGLRRVGLGVDAGNETGALHLYESVGMRVVTRMISLERPAGMVQH